jgi:hypothetical protein|tara:strand:+ start:11873 stop:13573 length:1701 start_codon:yes stop_codon:yes gene_type:complete
MNKIEFLEELKKLTDTTEYLKASRSVSELRGKFEDFLIEEERLRQVALLEAGEEVTDNKEVDPVREEFNEIYRVFQMKRKDASDLKKEVQENNLKTKKAIIAKLKDIIQNEENIGAAFGSFKEIHDAWKEAGDIPREKRDDIQAEYSKLLESFFYNMKIYRELKEHDLHRNEQLKLELITKIQELQKLSSIKETESQLKTIQNEWDEIGPVAEGEWDKIKTAYWDNVKAVYGKINAFYDERRQKLTANIDLKKALIEKVRASVEGVEEINSAKDWETKTTEIIAIQNEWKHIGFGPKKENEEVWKEFRAICDTFFDAKKGHYETIREESKHLVEAKQKLIDKAKEINHSEDWKTTADQLIRLQNDWKKIGHTGQKSEQKLWRDFRGASDVFFNARKKHFEEKDKQNETNLVAKQAVITNILAYEIGEDKKQGIADLKAFAADFNKIGHVPMKQKDEIYNSFKTAMDNHYQKLKLEGLEKEKVMFQAKMDTFKASPNSGRLMDKEKSDLQRIIQNIKAENIQYENNLGFFGRSKGAEEMKKDVEKKIELNKRKIEELIRKLKLIPNE